MSSAALISSASVFLLLVPEAVIAATELALDTCRYDSIAAVRAVWRPINPASPAVETATVNGKPSLRLPANFATNTRWRVGWDRRGTWDLSQCRKIELDVAAPAERGAQMIFHLRSGEGWYGTSFDVPPGRHKRTLKPKQFGIEGEPAGWGKIDGMRLSILRGDAVNYAVLVHGIHAEIRPAHVAIYQNNAGVRRESAVPAYTQSMAAALDRLGIGYQIVNDKEVAAGALEGKRTAILPLNPVMPKPARKAVERFVAGGGKLIVCYCLPDPLGGLLDIRLRGATHGRERHATIDAVIGGKKRSVTQHSWIAREIVNGAAAKIVGRWRDARGTARGAAITQNEDGFFVGHVLTVTDARRKDELLATMLGDLWPTVWAEVFRGRTAAFDKIPAPVAANDRVLELTARAARLRADAARAAAAKQFDRAATCAAGAAEMRLRAYAASLSSKKSEIRAVWCHSPAGVAGQTWDEAMKTLADSGFNTIVPNMLWGAEAAYPSQVLVQTADSRKNGDRLAQCVAAAKKHGIAVHVWKVNWNLWSTCPGELKTKLRREGRLQVDPSGKTVDYLCPSDPRNQKQELDAMLEVVRNYDVAGVHFDYIRYPDERGCYCSRCRAQFEKQIDRKVATWPADVRRGELLDPYRQFRRDRITRLVAAVSTQARRIKPRIQISAAVFWHWPSARDSVAQDWPVWIKKGYLDFVCPMAYTPDPAAFEGRVKLTKKWVAGRIPLVPGIGATLSMPPLVALRQVQTTRRHETAGFILFNYDAGLAGDVLPLLRLGATRKATR
jgi:uncharacterized lipoprotein YddW (UPF0748 family)